jgi:hypothetical protein
MLTQRQEARLKVKFEAHWTELSPELGLLIGIPPSGDLPAEALRMLLEEFYRKPFQKQKVCGVQAGDTTPDDRHMLLF